MQSWAIGILFCMSFPVFAYDHLTEGDRSKQCQTDEGSGQQICAHVSINGCTLEGRNYAEDVSCPTVRAQGRPFRPISAPREPNASDPRLNDPAFMEDLAWVTTQIRSCGCTCCHDTSKLSDYALWDINKPYVWIAQMTRRGVVIMDGQLSSIGFGNISAAENNGFDRTQTGAPTTNIARFKNFFRKEADSRGITPEEVAKMRAVSFPTPPPRP